MKRELLCEHECDTESLHAKSQFPIVSGEVEALTVSTFGFSRFWEVLGFEQGRGSDGSLGRTSVRAGGISGD
jgi:hypothetical protein